MSEQMNNLPEKWEAPQPWKAKCNNEECPVDEYELNGNNAAMGHYEDKTECNFIYSVCPRCSHRLRVYVEGLDPEEANKRGLQIVDDEAYPDDNIFEEWLGAKGYEVPKTYELTDRHEKAIAGLADVLKNIPDDLLMGVMSDPAPPQTMPQRWI